MKLYHLLILIRYIGEREDGYLKLTCDNVYNIMTVEDEEVYATNHNMYKEIKVKFNDTMSTYSYFTFSDYLGSKWTVIKYEPATTTITVGIGNSYAPTVWDTSTTMFYNITQNQWVTFAIVGSYYNNWIAYFVDGILIHNDSDIGAYWTGSIMYRSYIMLDDTGGGSSLWLDYYQTGWRTDWWWISSEGWAWNIKDASASFGERNDNGVFSFWSTVTDNTTYLQTTSTEIGTIADGFLLETRIRALDSLSDYDKIIFSTKLSDSANPYAFIGTYLNGTTWVGICTWQNASSILEAIQIVGTNLLDGSLHILRIYRDTSASQRIVFEIDGVNVHDSVYSSYTFDNVFINANIFIDNAAGINNSTIEIDVRLYVRWQ